MKVLLIFTYEYSLKTWEDSGTLSRELSIYKELENTLKVTMYNDVNNVYSLVHNLTKKEGLEDATE